MASLRARDGNLFFDFRFHGERCREYLHVPDTPANREALQPTLDKLNRDLAMGTFDYVETFPNSPRVTTGTVDRLGPRALARPQPASAAGYFGAEVKAARKATPTTAKFAEVWFSESKVSWRATYVTTVRDILDNHIVTHFGNWRVDEITRAELLNFRATVAAKRGKKPGSTLSPVRVNTIMLITKQLLEEAADRYEFTCPFVRIKPLKVPKSDIQPFTLDEVQRILNGVRPDFRTYFLVRFFTGMRTGEIDGLKWKYVDFEKRQILIRETIVRGEEEYTKTDSSQREIQMNSLVYDALRAHQKLTSTRSDYVFCSPNGSVLDHVNVTKRIWYPTLRILEIAPRRPYQTRHTAATLWLAAGENPEWIARQMGHANTEMLFTVYSRFVPNLTRRDGSALEKLIAPIFKPDADRQDTTQAANDSSATDSSKPSAAPNNTENNNPEKSFSRNLIKRKG